MEEDDLRADCTSPKHDEEGETYESGRNSLLIDDDVDAWYASTFSSELEHLGQAKELEGTELLEAADELIGEHASGKNEENDRRVSGEMTVASLQQSLQEAISYAHKEAREKLALQRRLAALEKLEDLRLDSTASEPFRSQSGSIGSLVHGVTNVQPWDRDEDHHDCFSCGKAFSFTNRRHHCRNCGHIFCEACAPSKNKAPIPQMGFHNPVRHCTSCWSLRIRGGKQQMFPTSPRLHGAPSRPSGSISQDNSLSAVVQRAGILSPLADPQLSSNETIGSGQRRRHSSRFTVSGPEKLPESTPTRRPSTAPSSSRTPSLARSDFTTTVLQPGRPAGEWIDEIRALEIKASRNPTPDAVLGVVELYRSAIEKLNGAEVEDIQKVRRDAVAAQDELQDNRQGATKHDAITPAKVQTSQLARTRLILVENMHSFLELPHVRECLSKEGRNEKPSAESDSMITESSTQ